MAVIVRIPTPLRRLTQNMAEVETEGADIEGIIENLEANYPGMKERLCDEGGNIRRFVNIYLNDEDIRFLDGKRPLSQTVLKSLLFRRLLVDVINLNRYCCRL